MNKSRKRFAILVLVLLLVLLAGLCDYYYYGLFFLPSRKTTNLDSIAGVEPILMPKGLRLVYSVKWSPDGEKIAYVADRRDVFPTYSEIYIYDLITEETKRITISGNTFLAGRIAWSPDGSMIAASGEPIYQSNHHGIWLVNVEGSEFEFLTKGEALTWSPNGEQLAILARYHSDQMNQNVKIAKVFNTNTNGEQTLYEFERFPSTTLNQIEWSPDGKNIVLTITESDSEGYRLDRLYLLSPDGTSFKPMFPNPRGSMNSPIWLPDGDWLAFISSPFDEHTVSVAPSTGECILSWLPESIKADSIDVSPDGKKVVLTYFGLVYIVDIEEVAGADALPNALRCP